MFPFSSGSSFPALSLPVTGWYTFFSITSEYHKGIPYSLNFHYVLQSINLQQFNLIISLRKHSAKQKRHPKGHRFMIYLRLQKKGVEPSRYCYHTDLNRARLPIPPLLHYVAFASNVGNYTGRIHFCQCFFSYALSSIPKSFKPFKILFITEVISFSSSVWSCARKVME